ncbi:MAG: metal ABC transporter solute-binding protein, Zn/Mn family [Planctomycetaceae bacterium]
MRLAALFLIPILAACTSDSPASGRSGGKVRVVATTGMVADLARRIGGDFVEVEALMGPGVDPHLYKASAGDLARLRAADLILYNGLQLEGKMGDLFVEMANRRKVAAVTSGLPQDRLLEPEELEGHYDPHVWFDTALWAETTTAVADALASVDAERGAAYRERARDYREQLLALDREVRDAVASIPKESRVLVTSHDAFRYFGRAYDVEVAGLQGISTVDEPGVEDVRRIAELVVARKLKAIFVETSVSSKAIEAVIHAARERGHEVREGGTLYSDAMGSEPPENTYLGMVRANVRTFVEAMR